MKKLKVSFLWHMHQPYYLDENTHEFLLPWVRLHSTRGYYDMVKILNSHPNMKVNINLVPALLLQLEKYFTSNTSDKYYKLSLKNPKDLTEKEKIFILSKFYMINWDVLLPKFPRYDELLKKRGYQINKDISKEALNIFTNRDFLDLQVWFNLAWFGFSLVKEEPFLAEMIKKGRDFTQEEKEKILSIQMESMKKIIPLYKEFQEKGQIEISVSPFYHPITPLLYDNKLAKDCMPNIKLPNDVFNAPEDANMQINKAKRYYEEKFSKQLNGMWPSEGSVSQDVVRLFAENDIKWIATDEQILFNSLSYVPDRGKTLYSPYKMNFQDKEINIFFRDVVLSDNIGFKYAKLSAADAANDFYKNLKIIAEHLKNDKNDHIVSVILDGENAWEYYENSGENFLNALYEKIANDDLLESITFNDYLKQYDSSIPLSKIYTGSWINHDFGIWIGNYEENKAWSLLSKTRQFLVSFIKDNSNYNNEKISLAWEELYQAEGSDWFWWYGDNFSTENDDEFDNLFRKHLKNVYQILDIAIPEELNIPISEKAKEMNISQPKAVINPIINGKVNNYFEWWGAARYTPKIGAAMARNVRTTINNIYYGYNNLQLFIRFDFNSEFDLSDNNNIKLKINFIQARTCKDCFYTQ